MYKANLENRLISSEISDLMQDYVSIQLDIDDTKIRAAALVAQLYELLIAPWSYYTYARCLTMFQGTFTDSGYSVEAEAESRQAAKSVGQEMKAIGDSFMLLVTEYLETEDPNTKADDAKLAPRIRSFGGKENRASN